MRDDDPLSPDLLLRRAAQGDAARATELLAYVSPTKLLDAVLTQAELAVDEDRDREAGIDAIAELDRAAIEVMNLPQGADLDLDITIFDHDDADPDEVLRLIDPPVLIGWELATVPAEDLMTAIVTLPVRPWQLALVAFSDQRHAADVLVREVVAAAADGRMITATLRFAGDDDPELFGATVTRDPDTLGSNAALATNLRAALSAAAQGG